MPALDLSTAVLFNGVEYDGTALVATTNTGDQGAEFTLPGAHVADLTSHYQVTITYDAWPDSGGIYLYSIPSPDAAGYSAGYWYEWGRVDGGSQDTGTGGPGSTSATIYLGPGVDDWYLMRELAAGGGGDERYMVFYVMPGTRITGITFEATSLATSSPVAVPDVVQDERADHHSLAGGLIDADGSVFGNSEERVVVDAPGEHYIFTGGQMLAAVGNANEFNDGLGAAGTQTLLGTWASFDYYYGPGGVLDGARISELNALATFNPSIVRGRYQFYPPARPPGAIGYVWNSGADTAGDWATPTSAVLLADQSQVSLISEDTTANEEDRPDPPDPANVWQPKVTVETRLLPVALDADGHLLAMPKPDAGDVLQDWTFAYGEQAWIVPASGGAEGTVDQFVDSTGLHIGDLDLTKYVPDMPTKPDKATEWVIWTRVKPIAPKGEGIGRSTSLDSVLTMHIGGALTAKDFRGNTVSGVVIRWTYRPPGFRWVMAEPDEPVTYRRVFPRDDTLGAGGRRNYPRPRSLQSGNRTSGYL